MTETSIARQTPGPWYTGGIFDPNGPDPRMNVWGPCPGDWIITEMIDGSGFYPCKPDIFEATYEPVE